MDYRVPDRLLGRVEVGSVVRVPLHGRRVRAFVIGMADEPAVPKTSVVSALISREPLFTAGGIATARWTADRYVSSLGSVLRQATPGRLSAPACGPRGPRSQSEGGRRSERPAVLVAPSPGAEIEAALDAVREVRGPALVLAPRVATVEAIAASLDDAIAVHGDMSPPLRAAAWARARDGQARVVVGARAALFAPISPELVVVVGAHDDGLKAERSPRLHGLVVAQRRALDEGAGFLACSVAPPLDLAGPRAGGYRWTHAPPPPGRVRPEMASPRGGPVTPRLNDMLRWATSRGEDALVFVARRGLALRVRCEECGWYPRCDACGTGLAVFEVRDRRRMRCRSCGASSPPPSTCPECSGGRLQGVGWGTARLASALAGAGLGAPLVRCERDEPLPVRRQRPSIIVGTRSAIGALAQQSLGAVCVADLDQLLGLADFRACERGFQTLQELAGLVRPGGRFLVQTREPSHHVVQAFARGSYRWFASRELPLRRAAGYPPFGVIVRVDLGPEAVPALRAAARSGGGEVVGPLLRPGGRGSSLVRASTLEPLLGPLRELSLRHPSVRIDVDPV